MFESRKRSTTDDKKVYEIKTSTLVHKDHWPSAPQWKDRPWKIKWKTEERKRKVGAKVTSSLPHVSYFAHAPKHCCLFACEISLLIIYIFFQICFNSTGSEDCWWKRASNYWTILQSWQSRWITLPRHSNTIPCRYVDLVACEYSTFKRNYVSNMVKFFIVTKIHRKIILLGEDTPIICISRSPTELAENLSENTQCYRMCNVWIFFFLAPSYQ